MSRMRLINFSAGVFVALLCIVFFLVSVKELAFSVGFAIKQAILTENIGKYRE